MSLVPIPPPGDIEIEINALRARVAEREALMKCKRHITVNGRCPECLEARVVELLETLDRYRNALEELYGASIAMNEVNLRGFIRETVKNSIDT
jgi:hypothetical protein